MRMELFIINWFPILLWEVANNNEDLANKAIRPGSNVELHVK